MPITVQPDPICYGGRNDPITQVKYTNNNRNLSQPGRFTVQAAGRLALAWLPPEVGFIIHVESVDGSALTYVGQGSTSNMQDIQRNLAALNAGSGVDDMVVLETVAGWANQAEFTPGNNWTLILLTAFNKAATITVRPN